jgi:outer membrane protein assembly factor BamB
MASSSWPKFRRDLQNTGAISGVTFSPNPSVQATFTSPSGQPFAASPVLGNGPPETGLIDQRVYIGSLDGRLYALRADDLTELPSTEFTFAARAPISGTALTALRLGAEALFVGSTDTNLYALNQSGGNQPDFWPSGLSGTISASPTIVPLDGTVFLGSFSQLFFGVCPNGIQRFAISTLGPMDSSPAVTTDNLVVFGGSDRQLRGMGSNGFVVFSVTMAGGLANAPVVEVDSTQQPPKTVAIYTVDSAGGLLSITPTGQPKYSRLLPAPVSQSSPALAGGRLYVGDDTGHLHAIRASDGSIAWSFAAAGSIRTSPAVASNGGVQTVVVASVDGTLYLIEDAGDGPGTIVSVPLGAATQSSPAIRRNSDGSGTIYIGDQSGRVLLIR